MWVSVSRETRTPIYPLPLSCSDLQCGIQHRLYCLAGRRRPGRYGPRLPSRACPHTAPRRTAVFRRSLGLRRLPSTDDKHQSSTGALVEIPRSQPLDGASHNSCGLHPSSSSNLRYSLPSGRPSEPFSPHCPGHGPHFSQRPPSACFWPERLIPSHFRVLRPIRAYSTCCPSIRVFTLCSHG